MTASHTYDSRPNDPNFRTGPLETLAAQHASGAIHVVPGDLTDPTTPEALVTAALERHGRLDGLVNNAGITRVVRAEKETVEQFTELIALNLIATFACCRAAFPPLKDSGGSIVNVASIMGSRAIGVIPQAGCCASKGGVVNLTRELAAQWARDGVRVNAIAPGMFEAEHTMVMESDERSARWLRRKVPMGRMGRAGELDGALGLLLGPAGSYITGQVVTIDGGWTAY